MKQSLLKEIIELKKQKKEFAILTDISNATSEIYTQKINHYLQILTKIYWTLKNIMMKKKMEL
jgi:hypothetical protein